MKSTRLATLCVALGLAASLTTQSQAQITTVATDNSGNYGGAGEPGWTNNSTAGTGFGPWTISTSGAAGTFLGDAARHGAGAASLDTGGQSFMMWAEGSAEASRSLTSSLATGQTLSASFAMKWDNGNRGIALSNGGSEVFFFNVNSRGLS